MDETFFADVAGRRRECEWRACETCGARFAAALLALRRPGHGRFCSKSCRAKWQITAGRTAISGPKDGAANPNYRHGHAVGASGTGTYESWQGAKKRCYNRTSQDFPEYGGRGIEMCQEWRRSFKAFLRDMGECPPGHSLDRWPNNNGNYEPSNCRWATVLEQNRNRRPRRWQRKPAA